jgi:gliding motility-associated protein GldE
MTRSTVIVNRVVTKKEERLSLDDLSHALEITDVEEQKDKNMLEEILKFGGKTVSDVMTPRVDMTCVDWDMTFDQLLATVRESGYSRLPVYVDNQDNIKGIVYAKDLLPFVGKKDAAFKWQSLLRDAFFVPESRMIDDILEDFQKKKMHMAIVVDEYGGTQGVVTLEDVLEEIVGEINDEYDDDEKNYKRLSQDIYEFEGKTQLNDFYRITGLDDDEFADVDEDAETIAGLLLNIKHDFPQENELIEYGRCRFRVMAVERHRIEKVKVKILQDKPETKEE